MPTNAFDHPDDWSYSGATGPENWGEIAPLCDTGERQSPINLADFTPAELKPLRFAYDVTARRIVNNGHCIQVFFEPGGYFEIEGRRYQLDHLHFHVPSEHHIEGRSYAMEAHFVHKNEEGNTAVVALLYERGAADPAFAKIEARLPAEPNGAERPGETLLAAEFLPPALDYYFYTGSLTTPPATEGVAWYTLKSIQSIALAETKEILAVDDGPNARPLQPRNGRKILAS